jgi:hypothetical protein
MGRRAKQKTAQRRPRLKTRPTFNSTPDISQLYAGAHPRGSEPKPRCVAAAAGRRPVVNEPMVATLAISRFLEPVKEADVRHSGGPPAKINRVGLRNFVALRRNRESKRGKTGLIVRLALYIPSLNSLTKISKSMQPRICIKLMGYPARLNSWRYSNHE